MPTTPRQPAADAIDEVETTNSIEHHWAADAHAVAEVRHAARAFAARAGATVELQHRVALAVSEAATNVVLHAYRDGRPPGEVTLDGRRDGDLLLISVCDSGMGLGPRHDSPGQGLGLPLMGRLADRLLVGGRDEGGTCFHMRFSLDRRDGARRSGDGAPQGKGRFPGRRPA